MISAGERDRGRQTIRNGVRIAAAAADGAARGRANPSLSCRFGTGVRRNRLRFRSVPSYEIVIDVKGAAEPTISPETYPTLEAAQSELAPVLEILESGGFVRLPWYGGKAENIRQAFVTEALADRSTRTGIEELMKRMERFLGSHLGGGADPSPV
jgi:hypothetical protein